MQSSLVLALTLTIVVFAAGGSRASAQEAGMAPVYSRTRGGDMRGGPVAPGRSHVPGYGYGYGYYQPYVSPYIVSNWYARPYPYHFDYFRGRWEGRAAGVAEDCPCAEQPIEALSSELLPQVDGAMAN